ncbi:hypothetical protein Tco_0246487 [Tanacetum coccineum]
MSMKRVITLDKCSESIDSTKYKGMIGSLLYLTASRPDIMFSVCLCARFQEDPKVSHLEAVKRVFRHIKGTQHLGLWYRKDMGVNVLIYANSDHAGDVFDRKSTSGICTFVGSCLTSWFSKKQTSLTNSITNPILCGGRNGLSTSVMDDSQNKIWDKVKEPLSPKLNEDEYSICCENTTHMMNALKEARMESREMLLSIHHRLKMLLDNISKMNRKLEDEKVKMNDKGKEKIPNGKLTHIRLAHMYMFMACAVLCLLVASYGQEHLEGDALDLWIPALEQRRAMI